MAVKRVPNAKYMLLGAKSDLEGKVDCGEVEKWSGERGIYFVKTSAITGNNIEQAFFTFSALIDCEKGDKLSTMSSFACSYSSGPNRTETTKEGDLTPGRKVEKAKKVQSVPAVSFYLKADGKIKERRNCCA